MPVFSGGIYTVFNIYSANICTPFTAILVTVPVD